jgi:3-methyladenine DNA glycosylase AlkC
MEPLKNRYNKNYINTLATSVKKVYPAFNSQGFSADVLNEGWEELALKERMQRITLCLHQHLPEDFIESVKILRKVAPEFGDFTAMLFPDYVERYGLAYPEVAYEALAHFTCFSSSEFAIRPFILNYPEKTMEQMQKWSKNSNHHVRRLASEGCRPRLPWAMALPDFKKNPEPILPILEQLKADPSEYVRRSVANNLNDISKDHPELVLKLGRRWFGKSKATDKLVKHALRTLLKAGNSEAMQLFGFKANVNVKLLTFELNTKEVKREGQLDFHFDLTLKGNKAEQVRLEYKVYYQKANGSLTGKVFKIGEHQLLPNEKRTIKRKHAFKDLTTRKHHPGLHKLAIVINGREEESVDFTLLAS